jgi:uncharacterized protein YjiS (DUF1127 family)
MTVNSTDTGSDTHLTERMTHAAFGALRLLSKFGALALAKTASAIKTLQTARMLTALSEMNDEQLNQVGITRADIPEYAAKLMRS